MQNNFSHFGASFQEKLAFHIFEDRSFADRMAEVLKVEFLEQKYLQVFVNKVFVYRNKYGSHPSSTIMKTILTSGLAEENEATQELVRKFFARIDSGDPQFFDGADFIKEEALDFCRKQKVKEALIGVPKLLKNSSFDEIRQVLDKALHAGEDNNFGYEFLADFEARYEESNKQHISFGWNQFDAITDGGLAKAQLGVVIAPTGGGKSMVLTHLASKALQNNKNVVYYTCELGSREIGLRFDACLTGISLNDLRSKKDEVLKKIQQVPGKLIIKSYPTKTATTQTIRSHLETLRKREIIPDLIVVDYGDLLKPIRGQREKRDELESVYEELRAIAMEYDVIVWTASQTNRKGLAEEVITMDSIAEAYNKCFVADFIFTVSRKPEDKVSNKARFFVAKNRNGPEGSVFNVDMDTSNVNIVVTGAYTGKTSSSTSSVSTNALRDAYKEIQKAKN
jgi:archaellum biogenesis ATPase FlaH